MNEVVNAFLIFHLYSFLDIFFKLKKFQVFFVNFLIVRKKNSKKLFKFITKTLNQIKYILIIVIM